MKKGKAKSEFCLKVERGERKVLKKGRPSAPYGVAPLHFTMDMLVVWHAGT